MWTSRTPSRRLGRVLVREACDLDGSCTRSTAYWSRVLADAGFSGRVIVDGVYEDLYNGVGHDWVEVWDRDGWTIVDDATEQFDDGGGSRGAYRRGEFAGVFTFDEITPATRRQLFPGGYDI